MAAPLDEKVVRSAAIEWVRRRTQDGTIPITRSELANDFWINGARFPLVDRGRGIRKPAGWNCALSILTSVAKRGVQAYADATGDDGLQRYKLRGDHGGDSENESLRIAARDQMRIDIDSPMESALRRYLLAETKRRLHQPLFASQVMIAYEVRCAVCSLNHRELLDAAHIVPVSDPLGEPVVPNGLALCKIHHAAYDQNILGIRPDHVVEVHHRLLDEIDGPMLRYGLQQHHGVKLMSLPKRHKDRPDRDRLLMRYRQFGAA